MFAAAAAVAAAADFAAFCSCCFLFFSQHEYHLFGSPSSSIGLQFTYGRRNAKGRHTTMTTTTGAGAVACAVASSRSRSLKICFYSVYVCVLQIANAARILFSFLFCTKHLLKIGVYLCYYDYKRNSLTISTSHAYFWLFNFIFNLPSAGQA